MIWVHVIIDYKIQGLETVKITGFIRISPFRKLCIPWPEHFCELCQENGRYISETCARSGYPKGKNTFNNKKRHLWSNSIQQGYISEL